MHQMVDTPCWTLS